MEKKQTRIFIAVGISDLARVKKVVVNDGTSVVTFIVSSLPATSSWVPT